MPAPTDELTAEISDPGYPLRDEALDDPPVSLPPQQSPLTQADPGGRRRAPAWWMIAAAALLLLAGLAVGYALSQRAPQRARAAKRPNHSVPVHRTPAASPTVTGAPPPAPRTTATSPPQTVAETAPQQTFAAPAASAVATVPNLVGRTLPQAVELLRQAGLAPLVVHVSANEPAGKVVAQRPAADGSLHRGSRVRLEVSTPVPVGVPNVVGMTGLAARARLESSHFVVSLRYVPSTRPARTVVAQFPSPGTKRLRGTHVLINLSNGTRPSTPPPPSPSAGPSSSGDRSAAPNVAVPDVVGEDDGAARSDLEAAGFTVDSVDESTNDPTEDGVVLDQDPAGGAKAPDSSTVTIDVGRYSDG